MPLKGLKMKELYNMALNEFMGWFQQAPRPGFTKATVSAWRVSLEERHLGCPPSLLECPRFASWRRRLLTTGYSHRSWRKESVA